MDRLTKEKERERIWRGSGGMREVLLGKPFASTQPKREVGEGEGEESGFSLSFLRLLS